MDFAIKRLARKSAPPPAELPRIRAVVLFGAVGLLFVVLLGRSLYLQWVENDFLQGQGAARFSREIEVPAHRGRIVDRHGEALAISTPVKSLWVFRDKVDASPEQLRKLARVLDTTPQQLAARFKGDGEFTFVARQLAPETAERALELGINGLNEQNEYRRYYPGGEVTAQVIGFTGDKDAGHKKSERSFCARFALVLRSFCARFALVSGRITDNKAPTRPIAGFGRKSSC